MNIAIASDDGMNVAYDPVQCTGFVIFEVGASGAVRVGYRSAYMQNDAAVVRGSERGNATSPESAVVGALSDCRALIARKMELGLVRALRTSKIGAYLGGKNSVDEAARMFAAGHLENVGGPGTHEH